MKGVIEKYLLADGGPAEMATTSNPCWDAENVEIELKGKPEFGDLYVYRATRQFVAQEMERSQAEPGQAIKSAVA